LPALSSASDMGRKGRLLPKKPLPSSQEMAQSFPGKKRPANSPFVNSYVQFAVPEPYLQKDLLSLVK